VHRRLDGRRRPAEEQRVEGRIRQAADLVDGDAQAMLDLVVRQQVPARLAVVLVHAQLETAAQREPPVSGRVSAPRRRLAVREDVRHDVVDRMIGRKADALEQEVHTLSLAAASQATKAARVAGATCVAGW
jgi:hypothetical protein